MQHRRFAVRGAAVLLGLLSTTLPLATAEASAAPRATPLVSVSTDASTYAYGAWAKVTAHVAAAGGTATISAQSMGASGPVVKSGTVDAHGNLVAYFHVRTNTTFDVTGVDTTGGWGEVTRSVLVRAGISERLSGYSSSTHIGHTLYRVYHAWGSPLINATVLPVRQQMTVRFRLQEYRPGAWHTISSDPVSLSANGTTGLGWLLDTRQVGHLYRYQASFPGDDDNAAAATGWLYLLVRR